MSFYFNDTATTEIYTLSLHDALPISWTPENQNTPIAQWRPIPAGYDTFDDSHRVQDADFIRGRNLLFGYNFNPEVTERSEEHTSELQSRQYLVCRLLLEKKQTCAR